MPIRLLDNDTIGKIAAGEVVERPVSVVKELLENALDAGGRRIRVAIEEGGGRLIEVTDDGRGMLPEELPVAIQRHATSKLAAFEDLDVLGSLGFRGEALPSIGAVSDLTIRSRPPGEASAATIRLEFGRTIPVQTVGGATGATVSVRDLFANVPARKKFLRQPATEASYITRAVGAYAAAYSSVAIELLMDGRRLFSTTGSGDDLIAALEVYGGEVGEAALPLTELEPSAAVPGVQASGWVCAPTVTRSHRQSIVLFANGRWIQNRALSFALEEAFHSLLLVGRHPVAMVRVELDPAALDVNVHPTKAEVKFVDERAVCRTVSRAVHAALAGGPQAELPDVHFTMLQGPDDRPPMMRAPQSLPMMTPASPDRTEPGAESRPQIIHPSGTPTLRVLGQVGGSFIIAEGPDGMYLIDQHAAHERVMYEKILAQMAALDVAKQPYLDPLVVELPPEEMAVFEKSIEELAQIGFDIEPFAAGTVLVRAAPALVAGVNISERLHLILQELAAGGMGDSWLDAVAISTACHTSIRAGQALSLPEMRELIIDLERTSHPRACGHGRPTMLHLSRNDLEKQFQRR